VNSKGTIKVWGNGSAIRDFIYSEDIAFWLLEALEKAPSNYPINLGSGKGTSIIELANIIIDLIDPSIENGACSPGRRK
jgi:GDP-L-fucose synthase